MKSSTDLRTDFNKSNTYAKQITGIEMNESKSILNRVVPSAPELDSLVDTFTTMTVITNRTNTMERSDMVRRLFRFGRITSGSRKRAARAIANNRSCARSDVGEIKAWATVGIKSPILSKKC
tara:strand:+ start:2636 stop:3001 length:366 start_codon:yes stop_codon:yes gene_type:complete